MTLPPPDAAFHWTSEPWGAALRCRALDVAAQHAFTSKQLPLPSGEAWRDATASVGAAPDRLARVKQVHGNAVRVLWRGEPGNTARIPEADALVSNDAGLVLAVVVADCVPILIVDPARGAAAAVHAGWRGTCARVTPTAVAAMTAAFGSAPADLIAAIGPSAGPADYEVGDALVDAFKSAGHPDSDVARWFDRTRAKPHLDLWTANRDQLIGCGVPASQIYVCGLSTVAHPEVFASYRVAGERAGRMAALIRVPTRL